MPASHFLSSLFSEDTGPRVDWDECIKTEIPKSKGEKIREKAQEDAERNGLSELESRDSSYLKDTLSYAACRPLEIAVGLASAAVTDLASIAISVFDWATGLDFQDTDGSFECRTLKYLRNTLLAGWGTRVERQEDEPAADFFKRNPIQVKDATSAWETRFGRNLTPAPWLVSQFETDYDRRIGFSSAAVVSDGERPPGMLSQFLSDACSAAGEVKSWIMGGTKEEEKPPRKKAATVTDYCSVPYFIPALVTPYP